MQERRLTRRMKELLKKKKLNPNNWRYIRQTPRELTIIHRHTSKTRTIRLEKGARQCEKASAKTGEPE